MAFRRPARRTTLVASTVLASTLAAAAPSFAQTPPDARPSDDASAQALAPVVVAPTSSRKPPWHDAATRYARGSVSLMGGLGGGFTGDVNSLGLSDGGSLIAGARLRLVTASRIVFEPELSIGGAVNTFSNSTGSTAVGTVSLSAGASVGYAIPVSSTVVLVPQLGYHFGTALVAADPNAISGTPPPLHRLSAELPVTVLVARHVFLEPSLIASIYTDFSNGIDFGIGVVQRVGFVF